MRSRLRTLQQDDATQVKALVSQSSGGVPASYLNSQQTERERRAVFAVHLLSCTMHAFCAAVGGAG